MELTLIMKNMNTKLTLSIILALTIWSCTHFNSFGQEFTPDQIELIKKNADSLIQAYAWYGDFTENDRDISERSIAGFRDLFTPDATVLNDIETDLDRSSVIPVNTYIEGVRKAFPSGIGLSVSDIVFRKAELLIAYDMGQVQVDALKSIIGFTVDNEIFEKQFKISFIFTCSLDFKQFKIAGIRDIVIENKEISFRVVDFNKGNPLPDLRINLFYDNEIKQTRITTVDGAVNFSEIPPGTRISVFVEENQNYVVETGEEVVIEDWLARDEGGRKLYLKRLRLWTGLSVDAHGTFGLSSIKAASKEIYYQTESYTNKSQIGYSFGIGVSYFLLNKKKFAVGLGLGAEMDLFKAGIDVTKYIQNPIYDVKDDRGDNCDLLVQASTMEDQLSSTYISAPFTLKARWNINSKFLDYIYLNAGVKYSYLMLSNSELNGKFTYQGYYPQYNNLTLHDIAALNYYTDTLQSVNNEMEISKGNLSVIASAGISIPLVSPFLNVDIGVDFNMGLSDISTYKENYYLSERFNSYGSLAGTSASLKTQLFGLHLGISYDIFK